MACFYRSSVGAFLNDRKEYVLAKLSMAYASRGYTAQFSDQTLTWERDLQSLANLLRQCVAISESAIRWGLILEFSIPRKELRIDVVLLVRSVVVLLELKTGQATSVAQRQIEEYSLLLHYFHSGTSERRVIPIVVSATSFGGNLSVLRQREMFPSVATYWISPVLQASWFDLLKILVEIEESGETQIDPEGWQTSAYLPVPSILEAASSLRSGLSIREIAQSEASEHEIETVRQTIQSYVESARHNNEHAICFLTGVPGSGKTLVGLSLAHAPENSGDPVHFMSGNGPLVKVLQHLFVQQSRRGGAPAPQARTEAKTLIENVHVFARYYADENLRAPSNHAIIFDEAQRAWNRAQNFRKFHRDYSEPEMLLRIMERHSDWAVIVALVGGGQEINDGEAGLEEWGKALVEAEKNWLIYASPEVLQGGASTAGHKLFGVEAVERPVQTNTMLHLRTCNRSLRAEKLATWVNLVLEGDATGAEALKITERFPIFLSRDLERVRCKLREQAIGLNRIGLVGSSGAARLRAEGLEPSSSFHAEYPWEHWYLAEDTDIRSSYQCEVFATEFEIQGLELDWIGLCWGGDFVWKEIAWELRTLRHGPRSSWRRIRSPEKQTFRRNAYRVLLTRARQGIVIFVPKGDASDPTNEPELFESTCEFLLRCGVLALDLPLSSNGTTTKGNLVAAAAPSLQPSAER